MDFQAPQTAPAASAAPDPVLDAVFATVQVEQRAIQRRYMAVVALRGAVAILRDEGLFPLIAIDGDQLVLRVAVPGLGGIDAPKLAPAQAELPSFLRAQALPEVAANVSDDQDGPGAEWIDPAVIGWAEKRSAPGTDIGGPILELSYPEPDLPVAEQKSEPMSTPVVRSMAARAPRDYSAADDDVIVGHVLQAMTSGQKRVDGIRAAAVALDTTMRAIEQRIYRFLRPRLDQAAAQNPKPAAVTPPPVAAAVSGGDMSPRLACAPVPATPISAPGPVAAALTAAARSAKRAGGWPSIWSAEDEQQLVKLTADNMRAGMGKVASAEAAAVAMGRSKKAGESRIFNFLADQLQAELASDPTRGAAPAVIAAQRRAKGGLRNWSAEEDAQLINLVADEMCRGTPKGQAIAKAAVALGRARDGVSYRIFNAMKAPLADELARRLALEEGKTPPPPKAVAKPVYVPQVAPKPAPKPVVRAAPPVTLRTMPAQPAPAPAPEPVAELPAKPPGPRPEGRATQVGVPDDLQAVVAHIMALTKGDMLALKRDFAIIHLACAQWAMPTIAADLGMDTKAVKARFEALCGYDPDTKKGRFPRSHVYHALEHILTPKAVVA